MATTNYYTVKGMILGESTEGVRTTYGRDALGSVAATFSSTRALQNTYRYSPYGANTAKTGLASDPQFLWNGGKGYRSSAAAYAGYYVRARHVDQSAGRWTVRDPLWPSERAYAYVKGSPVRYVDSSGLGEECAFACAPLIACAADAILVCLDEQNKLQCIKDVFDNLNPVAHYICSEALDLCLDCLDIPTPPPTGGGGDGGSGRGTSDPNSGSGSGSTAPTSGPGIPTCPKPVEAALSIKVDLYCKTPPFSPKRCKYTMSCEQIEHEQIKFEYCLSQRRWRASVCYANGEDAAHLVEEENVKRGIAHCKDVYVKKDNPKCGPRRY